MKLFFATTILTWIYFLILLNSTVFQVSNFCNFFEIFFFRLKALSINFNLKSLNEMELWYPRCSNLVFIKLQGLEVLRPPEMICLLTNTRLKNLNVASKSLIFDKESFEKLVASQLDTLRFHQVKFISGPPVIILDSPLAANETIRTLTLYNQKEIPESTIMLFMKYFCGLVHLSIYNYLTDTNLQCIFRHQVGNDELYSYVGLFIFLLL